MLPDVLSESHTLLEEAVAETRIAGNRITTANTMDSLARVNLLLGGLGAARRIYRESLEMSAKFDDVINLAECLGGIALLP